MAKRQLDILIDQLDAEIAAIQAKVNEELKVLHSTRVRLVQQRDAQQATRKPKAQANAG